MYAVVQLTFSGTEIFLVDNTTRHQADRQICLIDRISITNPDLRHARSPVTHNHISKTSPVFPSMLDAALESYSMADGLSSHDPAQRAVIRKFCAGHQTPRHDPPQHQYPNGVRDT